jgi:hypothetical protein
MKATAPAHSKMHQRFRAVSGAAAPAPAASTSAWFEPSLLEILLRPVATGTSRDEHLRKEREIGELFARLAVIEAWTLHKRLANPSASDALASAFGRLILERRARLLAFLGDARRRAAITQATRAA